MISAGPIPYSIVRATQFFEFLRTIEDTATVDEDVRLPQKHIQPMAAADVAGAMAVTAATRPANGLLSIGPEQFTLPGLISIVLSAQDDPRRVTVDPLARYWGVDIDEKTLIPGGDAVSLCPSTATLSTGDQRAPVCCAC